MLMEVKPQQPQKKSWKRFWQAFAAVLVLCLLVTAIFGWLLLKSSEKIFLIGGVNDKGKVLDTVQIYDPGSPDNTIILPAKLRIARKHHMVGIIDERIIIAGGEDTNKKVLRACEIFDPDFGWVFGPALYVPRKLAAATVMDSRLFICGGADDTGKALNTCEYLDTYEEGWMKLEEKFRRGLQPAGAGSVDNAFFMAGKYPSGNVWILKYDGQHFKRTTDSVKLGQQSLAVTLIDGQIAVCGDDLYSAKAKCAQYRQKTMLAKSWPPMKKPRLHLSLVTYEGRVWALGGQIQDKNGSKAITNVESFSVSKRRWKREIPLSLPRYSAAVTVY